MIALPRRACGASSFVIFCLAAGIPAQIPNEGCPAPSASRYSDDWYGERADAGIGTTDVTVYGTVERRIPMPEVATGLMGVADLYHQWLTVDVTGTTWGAPGAFTKGGSLPAPDMTSGNLAGDPGYAVQPRPGTMPGLYLYADESGKFYQYGGPVETGPSPQTTAVYSNSTPPDQSPLIYTNNLSGAQLWRYNSGGSEYVEIKHVDGSVARYDYFNPWTTTYTATYPLRKMLRVTSVKDPYDNAAIYSYDSAHRLSQIAFQSGLTQKFNWATWSGWSGFPYDCLKVTYEQMRSGAPVVLADREWGIVFHQGSGSRHFGSRIYRIYSAERPITADVTSSAYSSPPATVTGRIVHELAYSIGSPSLLQEWQRISTAGFWPTLTAPSGLNDLWTLTTEFGDSQGRASKQSRTISGEELTFAYPLSGFRDTDLLSTTQLGDMAGIEVTDKGGTKRRYEFDKNSGHLYSVITTPSLNFVGQPRATHAGGENSGIHGIATTAIEPDRLEIYNIYGPGCVCQKPIERRVKSTVGATTTVRTYRFEYSATTKLLTKRSEPNPQAGVGPFPQFVDWTYGYVQAKTSAQDWGAWLILYEITPDGTYDYVYEDMLDRQDAQNHGQIPGTVKRRITAVRLQTTLDQVSTPSPTPVEEVLHRNLPNSPGSLPPSPATLVVQGQPRWTIDGDGVSTVFEYSTEGWTTAVDVAGADRTEYIHDDYGDVTQVTQNAGAIGTLQAIWMVTPIHALGTAALRQTSSASATHKSEYYFDRFGHLAVHRRYNKSSTNGEPEKHGGSGATARDWVETQWHYLHTRIDQVYRDRQPLDEAASAQQFLVTSYVYDAGTSRLAHVINPNGGKTFYDFDGFGTVYRTLTKNPGETETVRGPKRFITPFLELAGLYESTDSDGWWTILDRNLAGAITKITEPATTAPTGYSPVWSAEHSAWIDYATGGAERVFDIDVLGRVTKAEVLDGTDVLAQRFMAYDQLSRTIKQQDVARRRDGNASISVGSHDTAWEYEPGKASQLAQIHQTGVAPVAYDYWPSGLLKQVAQNGDVVDYAYHANTGYLKSVDRSDVDPVTGTRLTATDYDVDPFGQVVKIIEGANLTPSAQLHHQYAYNSLGLVDHYTDPAGKEQTFLPDAMGRIVEHVRVGSGGDFIRNRSVFVDMGQADGRTWNDRYDHLDHPTRTHFDFAGRPFIVQNPGADINNPPDAGTPHKAMSLFAKYDGASRLHEVYDGDLGLTRFTRDGAGRVIKRELVNQTVGGHQSIEKIAAWNALDWIRRDALGRVEQNDYYADPTNPTVMGVGQTWQDSIGRVHNERYNFALAAGNVIEVASTFGGGNPYRDRLDYLDGLDLPAQDPWEQKLQLEFTHDQRGRLEHLAWDRSPDGSGSATLLAEYGWAGGLRRTRQLHLGGSNSPEFDSTFSYDAFDRLTQIKDEFTDSVTTVPVVKSQFDYEYDAASNLIKEEYDKVDGSVGDRFAYDDYHRLSQAWMGVATMSGAPPSGYVPGQVHEYLTYGLDGANNRTVTTQQTAGTGGQLQQRYTLQSGPPQGPSNRYETVSQPAPNGTGSAVPYEYDDRGNLTCDGRLVYKYDYMSRLQEVWEILPDDPALAPGGGEAGARYAEVQPGAFDGARRDVQLEVPNLYQRLIHEHKDPVFRSRLRATVVGGVITMTPTPSGGGGMPSFVPVTGQLRLKAVFLYDAFNRRTVSIWVGITEWFHTYDGWREVAEYGLLANHAVPIKHFVWGSRLDELIGYRYKDGGGQWYDYHVLHGGQDTSAKLVDEDGEIVEQYEYDPYGRVSVYVGSSTTPVGASSVGLPFLWKGLRLDAVTGLYYMRNRFYAPTLGRFLSRDLIGPWGDSMNAGNGYCYAGERPLALGDPMGLQAEPGSLIGPGGTADVGGVEFKVELWEGSIPDNVPPPEGTTRDGLTTVPAINNAGQVVFPGRIRLRVDRPLPMVVASMHHELVHALWAPCMVACLKAGGGRDDCKKKCDPPYKTELLAKPCGDSVEFAFRLGSWPIVWSAR